MCVQQLVALVIAMFQSPFGVGAIARTADSARSDRSPRPPFQSPFGVGAIASASAAWEYLRAASEDVSIPFRGGGDCKVTFRELVSILLDMQFQSPFGVGAIASANAENRAKAAATWSFNPLSGWGRLQGQIVGPQHLLQALDAQFQSPFGVGAIASPPGEGSLFDAWETTFQSPFGVGAIAREGK